MCKFILLRASYRAVGKFSQPASRSFRENDLLNRAGDTFPADEPHLRVTKAPFARSCECIRHIVYIFREVIPPLFLFAVYLCIFVRGSPGEGFAGVTHSQYVLFIASRLLRAGGGGEDIGMKGLSTHPPCTFISLDSSLPRIRNQPPERSCYAEIKSQPASARRGENEEKERKENRAEWDGEEEGADKTETKTGEVGREKREMEDDEGRREGGGRRGEGRKARA